MLRWNAQNWIPFIRLLRLKTDNCNYLIELILNVENKRKYLIESVSNESERRNENILYGLILEGLP
jgi:hypothetical protein